MFQSQDWPLRPVSSQEPRATSSSPAWSLPQGCPGPTRSRGHPSGPPTPQPVFPREKMVPPSVPGQPLASGSAWDPSPGAKHQTRLLLQTKPRRTPSLCLDPRALLLPPLRPSAPRRAPPAIPSSPQAAPQLRPLARRGTDRFLSWVHGGRFPGPRPSRHRSPQRLPLPQQPPPSRWPRGPGGSTHWPRDVCTSSVMRVGVAGQMQLRASMAYLHSSSHTTCSAGRSARATTGSCCPTAHAPLPSTPQNPSPPCSAPSSALPLGAGSSSRFSCACLRA